ncbi:enoyl-CoA hydratase/isomerase family protein [Haloarchaeobius sp. TZWWS8]|uniref:enoyl-CoA hydratase/isomerase family protein n=1 Tax=Haloarchaeobius sp. TZWWS8 TaxID=3446121 RepID=UPI003EB75DAC
MHDAETLTVTKADAVGRITLDRPETYNSLDAETAEALEAAARDLAADDEIRCIVLTGNGPAFCSGADLSTFEGDESDTERLDAVAGPLHGSIEALVTAPKPTISAVNGVAAGGGLGLALAGDVVLAHEDARFEFVYPRIGLSGDGGSTWFLPRLLGYRKAREFALLDEPIPAAKSVEAGLATEVVADEEWEDRITEVEEKFGDGPTAAYGTIKELLHASNRRSLSEQLDVEKEEISQLATTGDYERGFAAFFGKEEPEFRGE